MFPGLLDVVDTYIDTLDVDEEDRLQINRYLDLVRRRVNRFFPDSSATWIHNFVRSHPCHNRDSVVSQGINYDLTVAVDEIGWRATRPRAFARDYKPASDYLTVLDTKIVTCVQNILPPFLYPSKGSSTFHTKRVQSGPKNLAAYPFYAQTISYTNSLDLCLCPLVGSLQLPRIF
ncbi:hypothetical protein BDR07DRAFT_220741 [Suillus spraguei]|nr:hypothetical protein BDR07DRAFT_220741 [Suillus spraguei]